ncbi:putative RNA-directed DNA polymerase from transposon X-element [Trichonephila clavipes]|nr:putative RNA-directed DNA polymerase from transposon X-element [Trichonephila clavipes]
MGTRLRKLKQMSSKLSDGKSTGGKGRLTDRMIDLITTYYGNAIRQNKTCLSDMRKAVWAVYFHIRSSDEEPLHSFCPLSAELEYAVNKSLNKPQSEAEISQGNTRKFKLPKLELTRFNGDPKDFLNFWSQFEKIHIDSNIDDDDKIHYLIQCSVPGSKMFSLVSSFPPTKENYRKAVQQVKERFGREDLLVQIYIRYLLGLVMKNASGKIRLELSELYDVFKSKLLALESLRIARKVRRFFGASRGVVLTGSHATGLGEVQECGNNIRRSRQRPTSRQINDFSPQRN